MSTFVGQSVGWMVYLSVDKISKSRFGDYIAVTRAHFFGEAGKLIPRPMSIKEELTDQTVCQPEWFAD